MHQKVSDAYPELTHYTSASGLQGILASQCLWASHARFLNDTKEIDYFFQARCTGIITEAITEGLRAGKLQYEGQPAEPRLQAALKDAVRAASELTSAVRETTLAFNQPHLLSFCGTSDPRVMRDGLLSQWRAYGRDGGYAFVLDTKRLEDRLEAEAAAFHYQHMQIANVHYHDEDGTSDTPEPEIREAEASLRAGALLYCQDPKPETLEDFYIPVTTLCCLYKHWGFHEEHEVRVVAIPAHTSVVEESREQSAPRALKAIKTFLRNGCLVPYIELLVSTSNVKPKVPLPITRVLVGPHRDAERRRAAVTHMLYVYGLACPVEMSRIPFIGNIQ